MTTPTDPTTLRTALEALGRAEEWLRPEPKMSGPHYRTIGAVTAQRAHEAIKEAIHALATPAPAADEARCGFAGCGGVRDDVYHEPCLTGGVFHDHKACHPFQPAPTPAPPTPPATERCRPDECGATSPFFKPGWHCRLTMGHAPGHDVHTPPATEERCARSRSGFHEWWTHSESGVVGCLTCGAQPTQPATEPVAALVERFLSEYGYAPRGPERVRLNAIVAAARAEVDVEALAEALDRLPYRDCEMWVNNDIPTAGFAHDLADAYLAARARRAGEGGS